MILHIEQAIVAFRMRNFVEVLRLLHLAFSDLDVKDWKRPLSYSALDAIEMTQVLLSKLACLEENVWTNDLLNEAKAFFEGEEDLEEAPLVLHTTTLASLFEGLFICLRYLEEQGVRAEDFPPKLSCELTDDGAIHLYAWLLEEGTEQSLNVATVKMKFEASFVQQKRSWENSQEELTALENRGDTKAYIQLLERCSKQFPDKQKECFLLLGHAYYKQGDNTRALETFMKLLIFGIHKSKLPQEALWACQAILREVEEGEERKRLLELLEDLSNS